MRINSHCLRTCGALALRSQSSGIFVCAWRPPPASPLTQRRPVGASSPGACARCLTVAARVLNRVATARPPRSLALSDPEVKYIYMAHAKRRLV
eukprot:2275817-Pleurochrysis_carterae.AAC.1